MSAAFSRRSFLMVSGAGVLTLYASSVAGSAPEALAQTRVPDLIPADRIRQFAQPLVLPGTMPRAGRIHTPQGKADLYDLAIRQFDQRMLPDGPKTTVWGYGATDSASTFSTPALTIRAKRGVPTRVRWRNELVDSKGNFLPHMFAVDPTLHWANPGKEPGHGGVVSTDVKPDFAGRKYARPEDFASPKLQYTDYDGPVPLVPHLHGAKMVGQESDGYSEAWFLPDARNIPQGFARHGRWWEFLSQEARKNFGGKWGRGWVDYQYPNDNRTSTLWIHDHALGLTRLNVYAGPIGFYLIEDEDEQVGVVGGRGNNGKGKGKGKGAILPHERHERYELNLAIQDRTFKDDGSLYYPDSREFFDPDYKDGPWYPEAPGIPPVWIPEYFGSTIVVNGRAWPKHEVEARRYTVRLLNGCNSRTLYMDFTSIPGVKVHQIAGDQGYLREPVDIMALEGWRKGKLVIAPAERYDLVVDFTDVPAGRHILKNVGPDGFFGGGVPGVDFPPANPETTGKVMAFDVTRAKGRDLTTPAAALALPALPTEAEPVRTRRLATTMHFHHLSTEERPLNPPFVASATMMGVIHGEPGGPVHIQETMWSDPVTENPGVGDIEDWVIYNIPQEVGIPHPIHIHEAPFEIMERGTFTYEYTDDYTRGTLKHGGRMPLDPGEDTQKDTTFLYPGQYMRLRMHFKKAGQYMWHCHLLEHEDNEMMRPFRVGPEDPEAPQPIPHNPGGGGGHH